MMLLHSTETNLRSQLQRHLNLGLANCLLFRQEHRCALSNPTVINLGWNGSAVDAREDVNVAGNAEAFKIKFNCTQEGPWKNFNYLHVRLVCMSR